MGQLCAFVRQARTLVQRPSSTVSRRLTSVQSGRDHVQGSIDGVEKRYNIFGDDKLCIGAATKGICFVE